MPPFQPLRKDDGPACRVCGCTQHNACVEQNPLTELTTCHWVETSGNDVPRWLCSACSGTAADMAEVVERTLKILKLSSTDRAHQIIKGVMLAATKRYTARLNAEKFRP